MLLFGYRSVHRLNVLRQNIYGTKRPTHILVITYIPLITTMPSSILQSYRVKTATFSFRKIQTVCEMQKIGLSDVLSCRTFYPVGRFVL